jgi:hypothetical protein
LLQLIFTVLLVCISEPNTLSLQEPRWRWRFSRRTIIIVVVVTRISGRVGSDDARRHIAIGISINDGGRLVTGDSPKPPKAN